MLSLHAGRVRLESRDYEGRWEITAEGECPAATFEELVGKEFHVLVTVVLKYGEWMKPLGCQMRVLKAEGLVWGTMEAQRESRGLRAEFMATRGR